MHVPRAQRAGLCRAVRKSGLVKKVGGVSVDGTKIHASASKHAAVSYDHAGRLIEQLTLEVSELVRKAEARISGVFWRAKLPLSRPG